MVYALFTRLLLPFARWGRTKVEGLDHVPRSGPVLVVPNHDSQWDPVIVGVVLRKRRSLRFLARANLWKIFGLGPILTGMHQIPIERGAGDEGALAKAVAALQAGDAVCIFPEGKLSNGERLPARGGAGRLAGAVPEARVILCAISGTTDFVRLPKRPRISVTFFEPAGGQPRREEEPRELASRLLAEIRERVPPVSAGRSAG